MLFAVIHLVFPKPFSKASTYVLMNLITYDKQLIQNICCMYAKIYKVETLHFTSGKDRINTTYSVFKKQ